MPTQDQVAITSGGRRVDNRLLAVRIREFGLEPSGDVWIAARVLRRLEEPVSKESLVELLPLIETARSMFEGEPSFSDLEDAIVELYVHRDLESATLEDPSDSGRFPRRPRRWLHVWRDETWRQVEARSSEDKNVWGTCAPEARAGDFALMYATAPTSGLVALVRLTSDAAPASAALPIDESFWRYMAHQVVVAVLDVPLSVASLRNDAILAETAPVRQNFRRSNFELTEAEWLHAIECLGLQDEVAVAAGDSPAIKRTVFASESNLEDYLVENLHYFEVLLGEGPVRLATWEDDGIGGRQPVLNGTDRRPDLVVVGSDGTLLVVELKIGTAKPEHVGQLAGYVARIIQLASRPGQVWGLLVTAQYSRAAEAALTLLPAISHLDIDTLLGHGSGQVAAIPPDLEFWVQTCNEVSRLLLHFIALAESKFDDDWAEEPRTSVAFTDMIQVAQGFAKLIGEVRESGQNSPTAKRPRQ